MLGVRDEDRKCKEQPCCSAWYMRCPADDRAVAAKHIVADFTGAHMSRPADQWSGTVQRVVADVTGAQTQDTENPVPLVAHQLVVL